MHRLPAARAHVGQGVIHSYLSLVLEMGRSVPVALRPSTDHGKACRLYGPALRLARTYPSPLMEAVGIIVGTGLAIGAVYFLVITTLTIRAGEQPFATLAAKIRAWIAKAKAQAAERLRIEETFTKR